MFEDYIQAGENWLNSSLMVNVTRSSNQKKKGRYTMLPMLEVRKRFGHAIATSILQEKKQAEASKPPNAGVVYWMEHPDAKGQEETRLQYIQTATPKVYGHISTNTSTSTYPKKSGQWEHRTCTGSPIDISFHATVGPHMRCQAKDWNLVRIWDALEFEEEENDNVTLGVNAQGDLTESQTLDVL